VARTDVTTTKIVSTAWSGHADVAEAPVTIDAALVAAGVRLLCTNPDKVVVRISNTHGSVHAVSVVRTNAQDQPAADYASVAIPATTGVRWFVFKQRVLQPDGGIYINFDPGHTGSLVAFEHA